MIKFVGLHAHSGVGSIADGLGYPSEHFSYAEKNGMSAMAITDHGNCNAYGYMAEHAAKLKSKQNPFKVIYGIEAYLHPSISQWKKLKEQKDAGDEEVVNFIENEAESKGKHYDPIKRRHHIVLVATNQAGLKNIFKLVTRSYREGFYKMPRIDFSMLKDHNEGIVASTACLAGLGSWSILKDLDLPDEKIVSNLENELTPLMEIFGKDRFFLEIQFNKLEEQFHVNKYMIQLAKKTGFKNLATCDSHYPSPDLWREREIYRILGRQKFGYTNLSMSEIPECIDELKCELYPKNGDQLYETYLELYPEALDEDKKLVIEAIERSAEIADTIEYLGPDGEYKLPKYKGSKKNEFEELKSLCVEEMAKKGLDKDPVYLSRLIRELTVIKNKNFSIYFTVLYDAIKELKKNMLVGPGRGSGAGSLVCYLLGITDLDPIRNGLLFERFLSEAREEYPDIDNDVEDRDLTREILENRFGKDNVIPVSNFNTLKLKSLIKDLGRLNEIPFEEVNAVTRVMEEEARQPLLDEVGGDQKFYEFTLEGALKYSKTFRDFVEKYPKIKDGVEVLYKQFITLGRHAGGVVICEDASTSMPVIKAKGGVDQTPWSEGLTAKHLEQWGLVKYDFLGLSTLRIIKRAIELILREKHGIKKPTHKDVRRFYEENLHPEKVLDGDPDVFEKIYQEGKFPGVFQFAEQAVQNFCIKARPETVGDIAAITSIWRPGPLNGQAHKLYVAAKNGHGYNELGHPILEKILGPTYGVLIYQEQFMQLAHELAGYSLEEADKLRKLLVKPVTTMAEEMIKKRESEREKFVSGCIENGLSEDRSARLWDEEILGFISYGFNKSHAIAYAYVSYQCAWLLRYYENQWLRAYLEVDSDRDKAVSDVVGIGYKMGKPDVLISSDSWKIEGGVIYPSLSSIKGIGDAAVMELVEKRDQIKFDDFFDFMWETEEKQFKNGKTKIKRNWRWSKFNKRAFDALIKVEGFSSFEIVGPEKMFQNYREMYEFFIPNYDSIKRGKLELFDSIPKKRDWDDEEKIDFQQEILGSYDKSLLFTQEVLDFFNDENILPLSDLSETINMHWFIIRNIRSATTKNGKQYLKLSISDVDDRIKPLNYFGEVPPEGIKRGAVYIAMLSKSDQGWINVPYGQILTKAS